MVEAAIVFPLLVLVMLGLVQFAVYYHVHNVVVTAVQEGAHIAAARGDHRDDGQKRVRDLLRAGLNSRLASRIDVEEPEYFGDPDQERVRIRAHGSLRSFIPFVSFHDLPIDVTAVVSHERFRAPE